MESSVETYILDAGDEWNEWSEQVRQAFAVQTLQEWICSENFKEKATHLEIARETTLGQRYISYTEEDQYWKDNDYRKVRDLLWKVYDYWKEQEWAYEETTRNGRPRRVEHHPTTVSKAMRYSDLPFIVTDGEEVTLYKSIKWSRSILGQSTTQVWVKLVTIKENVFKQIYGQIGLDYFVGKTREELSESLHLPKPFVNELCRWLERTGNWEVKRRKVKGIERREMNYITA
jgi:hypothetical protein